MAIPLQAHRLKKMKCEWHYLDTGCLMAMTARTTCRIVQHEKAGMACNQRFVLFLRIKGRYINKYHKYEDTKSSGSLFGLMAMPPHVARVMPRDEGEHR